MALTATVYTFDIQLADVDRGVYEALSLRVARHPSETEEYLVTRVLAYGLEYTEGIAFSKGLAEPDEPALAVRDLTGAMQVWVEVGAPDAARLHRASKATPRVAVYTHRDPAQLVRQLAGERIHRAEALELYAVDRELVAALAARLERRMQLDLSITDRHVFVTVAGETLSGAVERHALVAPYRGHRCRVGAARAPAAGARWSRSRCSSWRRATRSRGGREPYADYRAEVRTVGWFGLPGPTVHVRCGGWSSAVDAPRT